MSDAVYATLRESLRWEDRPPFKNFRLCYFGGDKMPAISMEKRDGYWEWQTFHRGRHPVLETAMGDAEHKYCANAIRLPFNERHQCVWMNEEEDESGHSWSTGCGDAFYLEDGTPEENGMKYCPHCGGLLVREFHQERGDA